MKKQISASSVGKRDRVRLAVSRPELLPDGTDAAFRQLSQDFVAFCARFQENRVRVAACLGLSGQQYTILATIAHNKDHEGFGIIQVADELRLSGAFVTIEVNKLVEAGLVRKRLNTIDRRRVLLSITAKGRDLMERGSTILRPSNDTIFGGLSSAHFEMLCAMIPRLVETTDQSLKLIEFLSTENSGVTNGARRSPQKPASTRAEAR